MTCTGEYPKSVRDLIEKQISERVVTGILVVRYNHLLTVTNVRNKHLRACEICSNMFTNTYCETGRLLNEEINCASVLYNEELKKKGII